MPVRTFSSGPKVRPLSDTGWTVEPVLVTVSCQLCAVPGLPLPLSWLLDSCRVLPTGRGEPALVETDSASSTAL